MKARLESGKIVKYSRIPDVFDNILGGGSRLSTEKLEQHGFYDVVVPTYDADTQVIYNLHFDNAYPSPTPDNASATREVFVYDVKDKVLADIDTLKADKIEALNRLANDKLQPTDWVVIRKHEKNIAIPSATQVARDAIRTTVNTKEAEINALTTQSAVIKYDINF